MKNINKLARLCYLLLMGGLLALATPAPGEMYVEAYLGCTQAANMG